MEHTSDTVWNAVPQNAFAGIILIILFLYLSFRHLVLVMVIFDIMIGWLRRFRWFPTEGKRLKALLHWGIAVGVFFGFLTIGGWAGWIKLVPKEPRASPQTESCSPNAAKTVNQKTE